MTSQKTILITGCSANGIGACLALALANKGHHIFATARNTSKIPDSLTSLSNVTILQLDVTSTTSVSEAAKAIDDHGMGLDVLVNNAGAGYTMPLLDADLEQAQQVYDANVWGVLRTTQALAGALIARRGRVVNISSVGGVVNTPWIGIYASSKAALSNLSETLRLELAPLGVSVVTLMVGTILTSFHSNEPEFVLPPASRYEVIRDTIARWASGMAGPKGGSVVAFAESIADDVLGSGGKARGGMFWKGPNSSAVKFVTTWMPGWLVDRMMSNGQGLEELAKSVNK